MTDLSQISVTNINWREDAACKGHNVEKLRPLTCWNCEVRWDCLRAALITDDRVDSYMGAMWLRGGITAIVRDHQRWLSKNNLRKAFDSCKEIGLEDEAHYRSTVNRSKRRY